MNLDRDQLAQTLRSVALPALAGMAGGGALGAYASAQGHPHGELPGQRRRRILRNALIAASLGGAAGATLPTGLGMLAKPYFGNGPLGGPSVADRGMAFTVGNALPLAATGLGGMAVWKARQKDRSNALQYILGVLGKSSPEVQSKQHLMNMLSNGDEEATKRILFSLAGRENLNENLPRVFNAASIMQEAGHPQITSSQLQKLLSSPMGDQGYMSGGKPIPEQLALEAPDLRAAFMKHLGSGWDPVAKALSWSSRANELPGVAGELGSHLTGPMSRLGELYSRYARPGAARAAERLFNMPGRLALLGGGIYATHKLQQALSGN